jgi:DNA repair exonuclease SbcCD nuclease subunit
MKFLFTADIHLSRYSQDKIEDETNLPERLHSIKQSLDEMIEYCINNQIENFIIGGDLLHGKSIIYARAQNLMLDFFNSNKSIKFYVIDGNHDISGKSAIVDKALKPLETLDNVKWISCDETYYMKNEDMLFLPYSYDVHEKIRNYKAKILISHFGLSEGMLHSGMSIVSNISMKHLKNNFQLVLLGHYHKPQKIEKDNLTVYYVGSPIQLDWGEKNDEKRFLIIDTDTLNVESIPLKNYKKYIEIEVNSNNINEVLKSANEAKDAGNHVKIIMTETVDVSNIQKEFIVVDKTEKDITNRGITNEMSQIDKFIKYLKIKEIPEKDIDYYIDIIKNIIEKVEGD